MSVYSAEPKAPTPRRYGPTILFGLTPVVLLLLAGWFATRPVGIVVDGSAAQVELGTTVDDVRKGELLAGRRGDLLAVDGSVITTGGGAPASVELNGRHASGSARLLGGDRLVSTRGADVREAVVATEVAVPFKTVYRGNGPWMEMYALGSPSVVRVTKGAVSGKISLTETITAGHDEVILRTRPRAGAKLVALTFDDGPVVGQTDKILDILKREKIHATFFMLGSRIKAEPTLGKRVVREGHLLGNHSYNHPDLRRLAAPAIAREIDATRKGVLGIAGSGTSWMRPPYGAVDSKVLGVLKGMKQRIVMWDVDPQDWRKPPAKVIAQRIVSQAKPGSVILLHDGGGDRRNTIAALPLVIRDLKKKGYVFVTVAELAAGPQEKPTTAGTATPPDGYGK